MLVGLKASISNLYSRCLRTLGIDSSMILGAIGLTFPRCSSYYRPNLTLTCAPDATRDPGSAPPEKLAKDANACAKQAEAHQKEYGLGPYDPTHGSYNWMYDSCMQAGGYQRKKP